FGSVLYEMSAIGNVRPRPRASPRRAPIRGGLPVAASSSGAPVPPKSRRPRQKYFSPPPGAAPAPRCPRDVPPAAGPPTRRGPLAAPRTARRDGWPRSEEHTSELQSLTNLVCRLL